MKIDQAAICYSAKREYSVAQEVRVLRNRAGGIEQPEFGVRWEGEGAQVLSFADQLSGSLSKSGAAESSQPGPAASAGPGVLTATSAAAEAADDPLGAWSERREKLFQALIDLVAERLGHLLGARRKTRLLQKQGRGCLPANAPLNVGGTVSGEAGGLDAAVLLRDRPRATIAVDIRQVERETLDFVACAEVRTADGRAFDLEVSLAMAREEAFEVRQSFLLDPLVVQFDGQAPELAAGLFDFDIDCDGRSESLHALAPGSGFLCLDANQDGMVNDGAELFGALSGDGFADLAAWDEDGSGWLDDADSVFDRLAIWTPGEGGRLVSAREAGLGAIHLGSVATEFQLVERGETLGIVRRTGMGLRENGLPVTIQQIDLAARPRPASDAV